VKFCALAVVDNIVIDPHLILGLAVGPLDYSQSARMVLRLSLGWLPQTLHSCWSFKPNCVPGSGKRDFAPWIYVLNRAFVSA
jgi:hypothetical protein